MSWLKAIIHVIFIVAVVTPLVVGGVWLVTFHPVGLLVLAIVGAILILAYILKDGDEHQD